MIRSRTWRGGPYPDTCLGGKTDSRLAPRLDGKRHGLGNCGGTPQRLKHEPGTYFAIGECYRSSSNASTPSRASSSTSTALNWIWSWRLTAAATRTASESRTTPLGLNSLKLVG